VTQMSFNEDNDNQSLLFSPVRHISREEFAVTGKVSAKDEVKRLVVMTPYQADTAGRKSLEAPAKKEEKVEVVAEPVKRESKAEAKAAPAPKKGLDDVVKAWSEDD